MQAKPKKLNAKYNSKRREKRFKKVDHEGDSSYRVSYKDPDDRQNKSIVVGEISEEATRAYMAQYFPGLTINSITKTGL